MSGIQMSNPKREIGTDQKASKQQCSSAHGVKPNSMMVTRSSASAYQTHWSTWTREYISIVDEWNRCEFINHALGSSSSIFRCL